MPISTAAIAPAGVADPHDRSAENAEADDPATEPAQRTDEERRERADHGRGLGDPSVGKERRLAGTAERAVQVGPGADREPRRAQSHERRACHCHQRLPERSEPSAQERRGEEREREEPQQVGAEPEDGIEPAWEAGEEPRQRALERRGWVGGGGQQHAEQGGDEQDDICGSPRPRLTGRRREDLEAERKRRGRRAHASVGSGPRRSVQNDQITGTSSTATAPNRINRGSPSFQ